MDWLLVAAIGFLVGGFHGLGIAVVGYLCFWLVLLFIAGVFN